MGIALALLAAACGTSESPAVQPLTYTIDVRRLEPARAVPPVIYIDDVPGDSLSIEFPSYVAALAATHHVQLRAGDVVVAEQVLDRGYLEDCSKQMGGLAPREFQADLCEWDHGEVSVNSTEGSAEKRACVGDSFCYTGGCDVASANGCPAGTHCTTRAQSIDPLYTHYACAPVGTKQLGEACSLIPDPAGAYDDCANELLCVAGTCHAICEPAYTSCSSCMPVDGEPYDLRVCM